MSDLDLDLVSEVKNLMNEKKGGIDSENLYQYLIYSTDYPNKVKLSAGKGKYEAIIMKFSYEDNIKFGNMYAYQLLKQGDTLSKFQKYLDEKYQSDGERFFNVYFTLLGKKPLDKKDEKYGVILNWNKSTWNKLNKISSKVKSNKKETHHFNIAEVSQQLDIPITYIQYVTDEEDLAYLSKHCKGDN